MCFEVHWLFILRKKGQGWGGGGGGREKENRSKKKKKKKALCRAVHYYCCHYYYETTNANKTHLANSPVFPKLLNSVRICCLWFPPKGCMQQALKEWGVHVTARRKTARLQSILQRRFVGLAQFSRNWGTPFIRYQCTYWPRNFFSLCVIWTFSHGGQF